MKDKVSNLKFKINILEDLNSDNDYVNIDIPASYIRAFLPT